MKSIVASLPSCCYRSPRSVCDSLLLVRQAEGRLAYVPPVLLSLFFNHRLEQRDLRTYQTDLHQIFRLGRHVAVSLHA